MLDDVSSEKHVCSEKRLWVVCLMFFGLLPSVKRDNYNYIPLIMGHSFTNQYLREITVY